MRTLLSFLLLLCMKKCARNAMEALNQGADAYVTKPVKPAKLLALIEEKLEKQSKDEQMTESKVTDWIKTRARQLEDEL